MTTRPSSLLRWLPMLLVAACSSERVASPDHPLFLLTGAACTPPPANLVSWWPGDGNAADIVAGNDGTLQGGMGFGAGMVSQAFLLDGIDDYVDAGNDPSLHLSSGDFTVDAWVLFNDLDHPPGLNLNNAPQGDMSIVDKMRLGNQDGWRLIKQSDNHFWFCFGNGSNGCSPASATTLVSTTLVTTGVWYHVAVVKTGTVFALYVNGVQERSKPLPAFIDTHAGNLRIGSHVNDGAHLNGMIDEVEIFDRALSGAEIAAIHGAGADGKCKGSPPPPPPPPPVENSCAVVEYRFNETGTMVASAGSDPTPVVFKDRNGNVVDLHGGAGSGVSGQNSDIAFDNSASDQAGFGGRAEQPVDDDAVDAFTSVTFQGWFKSTDPPSVTGNAGRLFDKNDGYVELGGYDVAWNAGVISIGIKGQTSNAGASSPASYFSGNQWVFFAITYDGTAAANNVRFYRGTTSSAVQLVASASMNAGAAKDAAMRLSVGNGTNGVRALDALMDNMRIFASPTNSDGVLTQSQLEALRLADVQNTAADTDGDGLADLCDPDDDGDGYSDADEIAAGSNPLNPNSTPEVCDGADNDLDGQTDEGFADTDGDGVADCVDTDDDNDGLYDSIDDDDLVVSNHFTYNATAGTIVQVPANVRLALYPGGWPSGVMIIMTKVGPVGVNEILRVEIDGKQNAYETRPGPCIDWALLIFGRAECAVQISDPPAQVDVEAVRGSAEMVSLLYGQRLVIGIADGATAKITEITDATGVLTDVIVEAIGVPGSVTVNGNPVPVGSPTAIGRPEAPVVTAITLPASPVALGASAQISAIFSDANPLDQHTATIDWTDGSNTSGTVSGGSVSGGHTYTTAGVYTVAVSVSDGDLVGSRSSALDIPAYLVVYDPNGGFVTGGGWINSPSGAYAADPLLSGKASFGFVSKYQKGATVPSGNTEFQFQVADLKFKSTLYEWLVIAGARAQFKGEGTINGAGRYSFLLTAVDGQVAGGGGYDKFRIKIWDMNNGDQFVYDNQPGAADDSSLATQLGGGSVVIHTK